ncbi:MAG TPA: sigma-54 dependent transcriptional regulator, partial [Acidobacteriota bacterium]|nr:sigma-54 dependent transcriptional regulator [Acidobacteriota bacterium]
RDSTVLIEGETGTGKELVARAIHLLSPRKSKLFLAVNCAALTESVLTSQLFGHKRGAFTGAVADQMGLFEAAKGGTLFLDEIGDVPMGIQASLLRAVEEKEITRLGECQTRHVDVRVVVATNKNLGEEVKRGNFRSDLLYRIRVGTVQLPPLIERREDIPQLIRWFLSYCPGAGRVQDVDSTALCMLLDYPWAGNVRELKSVIEYAVGRCRGSVIQVEDLPSEIIGGRESRSLPETCGSNGKGRLEAALKLAEGNRSLAARILGVSRSTFYRHLDRYEFTD